MNEALPKQESEMTAELAAALAKAQGQMRHAVFDRINPHFKSKYATLNSIWDAIREPLSNNGLSITHTTEYRGELFVMVTTLRHASGQWIASVRPLKADIDQPQKMGSGETYAKRYGLSALLGITADEDDDGNAANGKDKGEVISDEQAEQIRKLIAETKSDVTKFLQWAAAESISDIRASKFAEATALLNAKRTQGKP